MTSRRPVLVLMLGALVTAAASAHTGEPGEAYTRSSWPFGRAPNETPEQVEAAKRELELERHAATFSETNASDLPVIERMHRQLDLRYRIAVLRVARDQARDDGQKRDYARLEKEIHVEKLKLRKLLRRN